MTALKPLILSCRDFTPQIDPSCWLAPNSTVIGDVVMEAESSCWFQTVIRGDVAPIRIGRRVNIQDSAVIHGTFEKSETVIEDDASIGHQAVVHGAHIKRGALVGMGAIVMDGAVVGEHAVVAAGAVVLGGAVIPENTLWAGVPAKQRGAVNPALREHLAATSARYVEYAGWFNE